MILREQWMVEIPSLQIAMPDQTEIPKDCSDVSCTEKTEFFTIFRIAGIQTIVTFCLEHGLSVDELYGPEFLF